MKKRNLLKTLLATTLICATATFAAEVPAVKGTAVKGNANSKIYHKPACRYYAAKSTTVGFNTEAEAQKAGYTACKQCDKAKTEKKTDPKKAEPKKTEAPKKK
jgi:methylphosphotriester-DNA--protein-cysteine methyltransferase